MQAPAVDLGSIPKLAADDPVIIAFSASRDMGHPPKKPASAADAQTVNGEEATAVLQITITISQVKPSA